MLRPPSESKDDFLYEIAARLTVIEIAVVALIRTSTNSDRDEALVALQTMEQISLEDNTGPPSPMGIAEYLRKAIDRLGVQVMGADWRDYTLPSHTKSR